MKPSHSSLSLALAGLLLAGGAVAQEPDAEGRRWYEVEVVAFTHENRATQVSERPLADPTRLGWLPRLRELQQASASLAFDFMPELLPEVTDVATGAAVSGLPLPAQAPALAVAPEPVFGPLPAPPATRGFRLADNARDPFIALPARAALLAQDARALESAAEHRVLWHRTWRQPMLPAGQSPAVLVLGGERYGDRHEVEGSIRFSDSGGRVQLDAHLWFSSFLAGYASEGTAWTLPELPSLAAAAMDTTGTAESGPQDAALLGSWMSSGAWQLQDTRLLTAEAYHYLDNPAIGVLVQIRPYSVPPRELPPTDEDF